MPATDLLPVSEAQERILAIIEHLPAVEVSLSDALGAVLAEAAVAQRPIPPFPNSAMDGYAVRSTDVAGASAENPISLRMVGEAAAGARNLPAVSAGEAARIFTGAPMPPGADAVVMQEDTRRDGETILILEESEAGRFVRPVGHDVLAGTCVLPQGTPITPAAVGMLAALGLAAVPVHRRPVAGILSTGDELTPPGQPLEFGCIYDSNRFALEAQVREAGAVVGASVHAPDDPEAIREALEELSACDVILSSGGVSVGDRDYVKSVLGENGSVDFWRVAVKPGKPLAFGHFRGVPFFGLPGNPVSSFVTFELFARPALRKMMGFTNPHRPRLMARLEERIQRTPGRTEFLRARCIFADGTPRVRLAGGQDSAVMSAMARANALIVVPEDIASLDAGEMVDILWLGEG